MSAVSWLERHTSSACRSGESSSPNAAWIPPCALAELHDCPDPFAAIATLAPARSAETAAARPEAPLPITSTSKGTGSAMGTESNSLRNRRDNAALSELRALSLRRLRDVSDTYLRQGLPDGAKKPLDLRGRGRSRHREIAGPRRRRGRHRRQLRCRDAEVVEPAEPAEGGQLLDLRRGVLGAADCRAEARDRLGRLLAREAERGRHAERVHRSVREAERPAERLCHRVPEAE